MGGPGVGLRTNPDKQKEYLRLREQGWNITQAAKKTGISVTTGKKIEGISRPDGKVVQAERVQASFGDPKSYDELCDEAKRAYNDFAYFQQRYFGRIPIYWQVEAAEKIVAALESEEEEWIALNCPPGSGKTTNFTHDLPAWITVRNRAITGLLGSAVQNTADAYVRRLKTTFERNTPYKADARLMRLGLAVDAEACLAEDFGRIKPESGIWRDDQFLVAQYEGQLTAEKEPTWSAFGRKGGVLGMRYQFVIWDDLADPKNINSSELIEQDREWYSDIAESRLEPGGTFILQGQRLGAHDLYAYAKEMKRLPDEIDDEADLEDLETIAKVPKYTTIIYKAHYEELCENNHKASSPAYGEPGGCLLYPRRLSWRRLSPMMAERHERFRVVYQQEDADPESILVQKDWVSGAGGHVGCWDRQRDRLELPHGVDPSHAISVATVDPSPSQFWAIEWWLVDPTGPSPVRYLMDLERRGMGANKFLDYIVAEQRYIGLAEEWQQLSYRLGCPITHWIFEINAAQKFVLQSDIVNQWQRLHGVRIMPHTTTNQNKNSEELGVEQLLPGVWERGLVRLPGKSGKFKGSMISERLVSEVTTYQTGIDPAKRRGSFDCVMAQWFLELHLPELLRYQRRHDGETHQQARPSWFAGEVSAMKEVAGIRRPPPRMSAQARMMEMWMDRSA